MSTSVSFVCLQHFLSLSTRKCFWTVPCLNKEMFKTHQEMVCLRHFLVDDVNPKAVASSLHLGDQVTQVFDGFNLLVQEVSL